jgi:hypothetical protein
MSVDIPGDEPVRLIVQQPPEASTEDGNVVLTMIVFELGQPQRVREIQGVMSLADAKHAASRLRSAIDQLSRDQRS